MVSAHSELNDTAHEWIPAHIPSFPIDVDLVHDTEIMVKAGLLREAHQILDRVVREGKGRGRALDDNDCRRVGLMGAQLGRHELVWLVQRYIDHQLEMFARSAPKKQRAIQDFHHDVWAQAHFLLSDYRACWNDLQYIFISREAVEEQGVLFYSATDGLQLLRWRWHCKQCCGCSMMGLSVRHSFSKQKYTWRKL